MKRFLLGLLVVLVSVAFFGCAQEAQTADATQRQQQEQILQQGVASVGMPAIKNFFEMRQLKDIYELRDQGEAVVTYTYLENMIPQVVPGHTVLGGKLTFFADSIGFGIPYATEFTNPQKLERVYNSSYYYVLPQADPNGLFPPSSAAGTWVLVKDPTPGSKKIVPIYCEPNVIVLPFKLPFDK